MDNFIAALTNFGNTIGLSDLAPDADGYCCLQFDGKSMVHLQYDDTKEQLNIFTQVGFVDVDHQASVYQMLLEGNFLHPENDEATLSLQPGDRAVFLSRIMVNERLPFIFEKGLENFMNAADYWSAKIEEANEASQDDETVGGEEMALHFEEELKM